MSRTEEAWQDLIPKPEGSSIFRSCYLSSELMTHPQARCLYSSKLEKVRGPKGHLHDCMGYISEGVHDEIMVQITPTPVYVIHQWKIPRTKVSCIHNLSRN